VATAVVAKCSREAIGDAGPYKTEVPQDSANCYRERLKGRSRPVRFDHCQRQRQPGCSRADYCEAGWVLQLTRMRQLDDGPKSASPL